MKGCAIIIEKELEVILKVALFEFDDKFLLFDSTPVENIFLQEYMAGAKGDYVKVYLYGLMYSYHPIQGLSLENIAKDLLMTVTEVEGAYRYWERKGLVQRISDDPIGYRYMNAKQLMFMRQNIHEDQKYESFAEAVYSAFGNDRQVHGKEIAQAYEWVEDLHLPVEVVIYLIHHCIVHRGKYFTFGAAEKLAVALAEEKVTTVEEAEEILEKSQAVEKGTKKILRRFGKRRQPSKDEMDLYEKWLTQWKFDHEAIEAACSQTTKGDPNMGYLDGILRGLYEERGQGFTGKKAIEDHLQKQSEKSEPVKELLNALGMRYTKGSKMVHGLYDQMLLLVPHEVLMIAAKEVAKSGGKMDEVHSLITTWAQKGITTQEKAVDYVAAFYQANQLLTTLYDITGHQGKPTAAHRNLLYKWQKEWNFSEELLGVAAQKATHADKKMIYMDKVLEIWKEQGINTVEKAEKSQGNYQDKNHEKPKGKKVVAEQQYKQRSYDEIDLATKAAALIKEAGKNE